MRSNRSSSIETLGSTPALADATGTIQTYYTYGPFGNTAISGASSANPFQFTGRENDGTGLYFYRARYYSPASQRFIAQDPLDFKARTTNLYSYVSNEPEDLIDSLGLYSCYYSIQLHTMLCVPDFPFDPWGISNNFVSGTRGSGCQNNPSGKCQNTFKEGPIPEGDYDVGPVYYTGGYPRHNLTVVPGEQLPPNRTGGFEFHGCGDPDTCSTGCIAAYPDNPTLFFFDSLFDLEPGSTIHVGP
jgi:RHS repeat-associated protein